MINAATPLPVSPSAPVEAKASPGAAKNHRTAAGGAEDKRRVGPTDRRGDAGAAMRDGGAAVGASARFMAQSYAQERWPEGEKRLTHAQAVAQYPSLPLFAAVYPPQGEISPIAAAGGHIVNLSA